jgi:hypothetical protein
MANPSYVRSTDGDNGAGSRVFVSDNHAESQASAMSIVMAGTLASPQLIICADDAAEPPTAVANTATVTTTGANAISIGGVGFVHGITFNVGTGGTAANLNFLNATNGGFQCFTDCNFKLLTTNTGSRVGISASASGGELRWEECGLLFSNASQFIEANVSIFEWVGGSILAGSSAATRLIVASGTFGRIQLIRIVNVDFSNMASSFNFVVPSSTGLRGSILNCKLPSSWTGDLFSVTPTQASDRLEMHNCDSGATNYRLRVMDYAGKIRDETVLVRTGGATDGATPMSWKMEANTAAEYPLIKLITPVGNIWNSTTGGSKTLTISFIHNESAALQNDEVSLSVRYPPTTTDPKGDSVSSEPATLLTTATDCTADTSSAWDSLVTARANSTAYTVGNLIKVASNSGRVFICTGAGTSAGSEPAGYATAADGDSVTDSGATFKAMRRQKLSVTFTPEMAGYLQWTVHLANKFATSAGKTIYVDPEPIVS